MYLAPESESHRIEVSQASNNTYSRNEIDGRRNYESRGRRTGVSAILLRLLNDEMCSAPCWCHGKNQPVGLKRRGAIPNAHTMIEFVRYSTPRTLLHTRRNCERGRRKQTAIRKASRATDRSEEGQWYHSFIPTCPKLFKPKGDRIRHGQIRYVPVLVVRT